MSPKSKGGGADPAVKARIITHMNNDHQDSLIRYLEYFCQVSSVSAQDAHLDDVTYSALMISANQKRYEVPIEPPLTDWSQMRHCVVEMDAEAVAGLGQTRITIKTYSRPYGLMLVVFIAALSTFLAFSRRENFRPGSFLHDSILKFVPHFANFCWIIQPLVIYPMVLLHSGEAIYMARSRLAKHHISIGTGLWVTWVCSTFIEGYGSFLRFDALVQEEKKR